MHISSLLCVLPLKEQPIDHLLLPAELVDAPRDPFEHPEGEEHVDEGPECRVAVLVLEELFLLIGEDLDCSIVFVTILVFQ